MRMLPQTCKGLESRKVASCRIALWWGDLERLCTVCVLFESKCEIALLYKSEVELADISTAGRLVKFLASGGSIVARAGSGRNFGF